MVSFISNLKASGFRYCLYNDKKETLLDYNGNSVKSKCAKDFICYDFWEKYFLKAKRKNEKEYYQKRFTITCAQKILNKIKHAVLIDDADDLANSLKSITNLISYDFGLCFEEKDFEKFVKLYTDLINSTNRWSLFGFSSLELLKNEPVSNGPLQLQIGPNMQKMIDEGQLDLKEMEKHIKDNKLNISLTTKNKDVNEFETIIEENEKYLQEFKECLEKKKYDELSIDKHINRVEYYLNHYLMIGLPRRMEEGCSVDVDGFIRSKVNTSIIPPSVYNIDLFLTSIKLFYTCMVEKGYVKQSNLDEVTEITNDCKDEYISDYYDKNPKDISIEDVIELIQQAHGFGSAHINFKTGQSAIIPSDEELYCGNSDDLYDIIENPDWNKIYDIDDKEVMKQYVLQLDDEVKSEKLYTILQQNKSYKDFIDAIYDMDIVDDYFDFYASKIEELALEWLQDNLEDNDFVN